jgi:aldose 1-epimerase
MSKITHTSIIKSSCKKVELFRLTNKKGNYVEIINYGGALVSVVVPDRKGQMKNIVLSYNNIMDYFNDPYYLGSTIGRFANRIRNGSFIIGNKSYTVDRNNNMHSLHGGSSGFNSKILNYQIEGDTLVLYGKSIDGENGFPGNINFQVCYSFSDNNELNIDYKASSDKITPLSLTNHAYFNLSAQNESILQHELKVFANQYLEMDNEFLPTGKRLSTIEDGFDFSRYRNLFQMMSVKKDDLKGYNTYFIHQKNARNELLKLASVRENNDGRFLDIYSTMPGVMFYTGDFLSTPFKPFEGLCLEAQYYPDFLNHSSFEASIIGPEKMFDEKIKFVFECF